MHNHFDKHLNLKALILERRPRTIVECGAGTGELTRLIAELKSVYDFAYHVISDRPIEGVDSVLWHSGLSYDVLKTFEDLSIDLCIIDTDHNYWTLMKEFEAVFHKMSDGGLIALHDVETFYHDTGMALSYGDGTTYPKEEIEKYAQYGGIGAAMIDFLQLKKMDYKLIGYTVASHGAAVIQRHIKNRYAILAPGPEAAYAGNRSIKEKEHAGISSR
jgi:hypothetical protein